MKLEERYLIKERAEKEILNHGSVENALKYLKAELCGYESLWSKYSSECLGHGITCTRLLIENLENGNRTNSRF